VTILVAVALLLQADDARVKRVVIVSVDSFRPAFYLSDDWEMPTVRGWAKDGAHAKGVESVFPSATYPAHATIVTGVRPAKHGIRANNRLGENGPLSEWHWDAAEIKARTLWQAAREKGLKTAIVLWPSTVGAEVDWLVPERWAVRDGEKTAELLAKHSTKGLAAELILAIGAPQSVDKRAGMDQFIADAAAYVFRKYKPHLMFVHVGEVDHLSHRDGPAADAVKAAVKETDGHLARLRAAIEKSGLAEETLLLVTGDHGFLPVTHAIAPNVLLAEAGLITLEDGKVREWKALAFASGGAGAVHVKGADAAAVRALLEKGATVGGRRTFRVLSEKEKADLGYDGEMPIALEAEEGYSFGMATTGAFLSEAKTVKGQHGYLPTRPAMRTGFVAAGAGVRAGSSVELMRLVDIAPTVAKVLGLEMKDVEGRVLSELLR